MSEIDDVSFRELASETYGDQFESLDEEDIQALEEIFDEKRSEYDRPILALSATFGEYNVQKKRGGKDVVIYAVGSDGPRTFRGETLFAYGVYAGGDDPAGRVVVIIPQENIDQPLTDIQEVFNNTYKPVQANLSVRPAQNVAGTYVAEIGAPGTEFEIVEDDRNQQEREEFIRSHVPTITIAESVEKMSLVSPESGFAEDFGVDFKLIQDVNALIASISSKASRYVFQDASFMSPDFLDAEIRGDEDEIGLVSYARPEVMAVEEGSIADVFGIVTPNQDGQMIMNAVGYDPIQVQEAAIPAPTSDDSSGNTSSDSIDERTI